MKKKIIIVILCICTCLSLFVTGCSKDEIDSLKTYSKYLKEYLEGKDSLDGKTVKALYDGEKLYSTALEGKLSSFSILMVS